MSTDNPYELRKWSPTPTLYKAEDRPASDFVDVPPWIESDITCDTIAAVCHGGCASGAYMPACWYNRAAETMREHGDDVIQYIEDVIGVAPVIDFSVQSWDGAACLLVSMAVELWCYAVADEIEEKLNEEAEEAEALAVGDE